jgi:hypothetical protein
MTHVPRATENEIIAVGDHVRLSPHYATEMDASNGPLTEGDIGTVIAVDDSEQPIQVQYNGQPWWYTREALARVSGQVCVRVCVCACVRVCVCACVRV